MSHHDNAKQGKKQGSPGAATPEETLKAVHDFAKQSQNESKESIKHSKTSMKHFAEAEKLANEAHKD